MVRLLGLCVAILSLVSASAVFAGDLKGDYLETRTCDVYTGPCFANGQVSLTGNDAIMAWSIEQGSL